MSFLMRDAREAAVEIVNRWTDGCSPGGVEVLASEATAEVQKMSTDGFDVKEVLTIEQLYQAASQRLDQVAQPQKHRKTLFDAICMTRTLAVFHQTTPTEQSFSDAELGHLKNLPEISSTALQDREDREGGFKRWNTVRVSLSEDGSDQIIVEQEGIFTHEIRQIYTIKDGKLVRLTDKSVRDLGKKLLEVFGDEDGFEDSVLASLGERMVAEGRGVYEVNRGATPHP